MKRKIVLGVIVILGLYLFNEMFCSSDSKSDSQRNSEDVSDVTYISKPVESKSLHWGGAGNALKLSGGLKWYNGFAIDHEDGYAKFVLDDSYENIHFFVGNYNYTGFPGEDAIATVWADDKKIFDGIVRYDGVPKEVVANISGVRELTFKIVQGVGPVAFVDVSLWKKGQEPRQAQNIFNIKPQTLELVKDIQPYYTEGIDEIGTGKHKSFRISGVEYDYGLVANMQMALIGDNPTKAHFYLGKQFAKLHFIVGVVDSKNHGSGWFSVMADGKTIYETEITHSGTAKQVTLDITGCEQLTFGTKHISGDNIWGGIANIMVYPEGEGESVEVGSEGDAPVDPKLKSLPDVTKLMSNISPFAIGSDVKKQIYNGESDHITFSMGGTRFSEGFILYETANFMDDNLASYVVFDLGNEFDYVRFTAGYVGKSWTMYNDMLRVWADDEMILETPLVATSPNKEFILPINKCRRLKFENVGQGTLDVAAYGIADLVVYRGDDTSENPFVHPRPDCPGEIDLIDLGKPYIHYVSIEKGKDILFDGTTRTKYFELGSDKIYKGFILRTSTHFSLDFGPLSGSDNVSGVVGAVAAGVSFVPIGAVGSAVVGSTLAGAAALLALAAGGTAIENSCAAFNTYGEYNSITFKVACLEPAFGEMYTGYPESLLIGVNGDVVQELTLYDSMEPQTVTIPIDGCEQLMFWLANTSRGWSGRFLFYDLKLSKKRVKADVPPTLRVTKPVFKELAWDTPDTLANDFKRVGECGNDAIDSYFYNVYNLAEKVKKLSSRSNIDYKIVSVFLESKSGDTYKAVRLVPYKHDGSFDIKGRAYRYDFDVYEPAKARLADIEKLKEGYLADAISYKERAKSALSALEPQQQEVFAGHIARANATLEECAEYLELMVKQKSAEIAYLEKMIASRVESVDSKKSCARVSYCRPLDDDQIPEGDMVLVDLYYSDDAGFSQ